MSSAEERVVHAIKRTKDIVQNDKIEYLSHGAEGVVTTDGIWAYKYFYNGRANFNNSQFEFIKKRILKKRFKHIVYLDEIVEVGNEIVFVMEFHKGTKYSGGYLDDIRDMLIELKQESIGYRNISPENLIASDGGVLICDLGHSFIEFNEREYFEMMKRAYLSYRFPFRKDLPEIMRAAINDNSIPELFGFKYFRETVESTQPLLELPKHSVLNPFSTFSTETQNFIRVLPRNSNYGKKFDYDLIDKNTGEKRTATHVPFSYLERSYMKEGRLIKTAREILSTDFKLLAPSSDFMEIRTIDINKPQKYDTTLLIKASPLEWETIDFQIKHIIRQLNTPEQFLEIVVVTDDHQGPFLRQYAEADSKTLLEKLKKLKSEGWIDRIVIAPDDKKIIAETYRKWFSVESYETHAENGQHTYTSLYGIEQSKGKYVLQMDSDCIIVRRNFEHDYLQEMISLLENSPNSVSVPFAVASKKEIAKCSEGATPWRTEVRFSLLHKKRLENLLPLYNKINSEGKLAYPWHRALDMKILERKLMTYRRGSSNLFFIHIQNETKKDINLWYNIVKAAERGRTPDGQYGNVDLIPNITSWLGGRAEKYVFIIRGRNVEIPKLRRMLDSVETQNNKEWGAIFIDAASDNGMEEYIEFIIQRKHPDRITFFRNWKPLTPIENTKIAISNLVTEDESIIITLDADDALIGNNVLNILDGHYKQGADLTVGSMLRTDKYKTYPVDFKAPRQRNGGNVWQHLRTFKKYLFDRIPTEYFKIDGKWITHTEDWAFMLPMVDIAVNPTHIEEPLYYYEPSVDKSIRSVSDREKIISVVINKPKLTISKGAKGI